MGKPRPPKNLPKRRVQVDMDALLYDHLRALATHDGRSMNKFILLLLDRAIPAYELEAGLVGPADPDQLEMEV